MAPGGSDIVSIKDKALRGALNVAVGRYGKERGVFDADLAELDRVSWCGYGEAEGMPDVWASITSLAGLEHCVGLVELFFSEHHFTDVTPIAGLTKLEKLQLQHCNVRSVATLVGLARLRQLDLGSNQVEDLSGLEQLSMLETLDVSSNPLTDLTPLKGLTGLRELRLDKTKVRDLSPVAGLPHLKEVSMYYMEGFTDAQLDVAAAMAKRGVKFLGPIAAAVEVHSAKEAVADSAGHVVDALRALDEDTLVASWVTEGVSAVDRRGDTLLHRVVQSDADDRAVAAAVVALVGAGVDVDALNDSEETALSLLVDRTRDPSVLEALLAAGPDLSIPADKPPLAVAAWNSTKPARLRQLEALEQAGADVTHPSAVVACADEGNLAKVRAYIAAGGSLNAQWDRRGALHSAVGSGHLEVVRELLALGADPNGVVWSHVPDRPIHHVRTRDMLAVLLSAGADPDGRTAHGDSLLHTLSEELQSWPYKKNALLNLVEPLVEAGVDINTPGALLQNLHKSPDRRNKELYAEHRAIIKKLLAMGADSLVPNHVWNDHSTGAIKTALRKAGGVEYQSKHLAAVIARLPEPEALVPGTPGFRSLAWLTECGHDIPNQEAFEGRIAELLQASEEPAAPVIAEHQGQERWLETALAVLNGGRGVCGVDVLRSALPNEALTLALCAVCDVARTSAGGATLLDAVLGLSPSPPLRLVAAARTPLEGVCSLSENLLRLAEKASGKALMLDVPADQAEAVRAACRDVFDDVVELANPCSPVFIKAFIEADRSDLVRRGASHRSENIQR